MAEDRAGRPEPLAPLRAKLPRGWEAWTGVGGLLYARLRRSTPPIVVRASTAAELARLVAEAEAQR